jgi:hypothetical protein
MTMFRWLMILLRVMHCIAPFVEKAGNTIANIAIVFMARSVVQGRQAAGLAMLAVTSSNSWLYFPLRAALLHLARWISAC